MLRARPDLERGRLRRRLGGGMGRWARRERRDLRVELRHVPEVILVDRSQDTETETEPEGEGVQRLVHADRRLQARSCGE